LTTETQKGKKQELSSDSISSHNYKYVEITLAGGCPRSIEHWNTASLGAVAMTSLNGSNRRGRLPPDSKHPNTYMIGQQRRGQEF